MKKLQKSDIKKITDILGTDSFYITAFDGEKCLEVAYNLSFKRISFSSKLILEKLKELLLLEIAKSEKSTEKIAKKVAKKKVTKKK